jgi:hypothetical protein
MGKAGSGNESDRRIVWLGWCWFGSWGIYTDHDKSRIRSSDRRELACDGDG